MTLLWWEAGEGLCLCCSFHWLSQLRLTTLLSLFQLWINSLCRPQVTFRGWATCSRRSSTWWRTRWTLSGVLCPSWTRWWVNQLLLSFDMRAVISCRGSFDSLLAAVNLHSGWETQNLYCVILIKVSKYIVYIPVYVNMCIYSDSGGLFMTGSTHLICVCFCGFIAPQLWGADAGHEDSADTTQYSAQTAGLGLLELPRYETCGQ